MGLLVFWVNVSPTLSDSTKKEWFIVSMSQSLIFEVVSSRGLKILRLPVVGQSDPQFPQLP